MPEPTYQCNGICLTAHEVGIPQPGIALAHPDCEEHADDSTLSEASRD